MAKESVIGTLISRKKNATKCIYFPDEKVVDALEAHLAPFPRASVSSIFAQFAKQLTSTMDAAPKGTRQFEFAVKIHI